MKTITLLSLLLLPLVPILEQQPKSEPVYIVLTSILSQDDRIEQGVSRHISQSSLRDPVMFPSELYKYPTIYFEVYHDGRSMFSFRHSNFNIAELRKTRQENRDGSDEMEIITKPDSFLREISYIDLDKMLQQGTKEDIWELADQTRFKKVYVIDRSEMKDGQITLTEVRSGASTKPQQSQEFIINGKTYRTLW